MSSNTTPEPLAAIIAEMRHRADNHRQDGWESVGEELDDLADRIEAAYTREHAQWHSETNAAKEERNRIACKMRYEFSAKCRACKSAPGNVAAMREALIAVRGDLTSALHPNTSRAIIDAALAAPPRNCDRFEDWMRAWDGYLAKYPGARHETPFEIGRFHHWLFAPAKEGGAE